MEVSPETETVSSRTRARGGVSSLPFVCVEEESVCVCVCLRLCMYSDTVDTDRGLLLHGSRGVASLEPSGV